MAAANIIKGLAKETRGVITLHCEMEWRQPYTQNVDSFPSSKENTLKQLRERREHYSNGSHTPIKPQATDLQVASTETAIHTPVVGLFDQTPTKPQTNGIVKPAVSDHDLVDILSARGFK